MIRRRDNGVYLAILLVVCFGALVSFNIWYTDRERAQADRRWCALISGIDDNYRQADPATLPERTREFAAKVHLLREELKVCPDTEPPPLPPSPAQEIPPEERPSPSPASS